MTATSNGNGTQAVIELDAKTLLSEQPVQETATQRKAREKAEREAKKQAEKEAKERAEKEAQQSAIGNEPKKEETPIAVNPVNQEELDYTPCKSVHQAMLIMCGERVDHSETVKGLCAIGKVVLQINTERIDFGTMTTETLQISPESMAFCYECGMESEDILAIALDAKKAWCLGFKTQEALDKTARDKQKRQGKIDKQKALLDRLKNRKA